MKKERTSRPLNLNLEPVVSSWMPEKKLQTVATQADRSVAIFASRGIIA